MSMSTRPRLACAGLRDALASRIAPAQVPKIGFCSPNWRSGSSRFSYVEQLEHGGAFAAGDDQAVEIVRGPAAVRTSTACAPARSTALRVSFEVALEGEDAYVFHMRRLRPAATLAAQRLVYLPAAGLHQFAFGELGDLEAGHGDRRDLRWLRAALRVLVIGRGFDDGLGADLGIGGLEDAGCRRTPLRRPIA